MHQVAHRYRCRESKKPHMGRLICEDEVGHRGSEAFGQRPEAAFPRVGASLSFRHGRMGGVLGRGVGRLPCGRRVRLWPREARLRPHALHPHTARTHLHLPGRLARIPVPGHPLLHPLPTGRGGPAPDPDRHHRSHYILSDTRLLRPTSPGRGGRCGLRALRRQEHHAARSTGVGVPDGRRAPQYRRAA